MKPTVFLLILTLAALGCGPTVEEQTELCYVVYQAGVSLCGSQSFERIGQRDDDHLAKYAQCMGAAALRYQECVGRIQ